MANEQRVAVKLLRRNWLLPLGGVLAIAIGVVSVVLDRRGGVGVFGLLSIWLGAVFAMATAWRNSYPRAHPTTLLVREDRLEVAGRTIDVADVTEAKIAFKRGRDADAVAVLGLRDGASVSLWMRHAEATALLTHLGLGAGDARASFRLALRFRSRLLLGYALGYLPLAAYAAIDAPLEWDDAFVGTLLPGSFAAVLIAFVLGALRGRLRIGADGITTRWLARERFVPFSEVTAVVRRNAPITRGVVDAVVMLQDGRSKVLRTPEQPDDEADRGAEGRALAEHLEAALERYRQRSADEVSLRSMLVRGGRSDEAWLAELDGLLRGGAARYRVATLEPAQVAAVVRDVQSSPEARVAAAAALVRFDPGYRGVVQRAADACAQAELQAVLAALSEAEGDEEVKEALRRHRSPGATG